jgi:hypothetical protein
VETVTTQWLRGEKDDDPVDEVNASTALHNRSSEFNPVHNRCMRRLILEFLQHERYIE